MAVDLPPDAVARCVAEVGIGFCFAPVFHPAMRYTGGGAPRAGRADHDERARTADQPGAAAGRAGRLRRRPAGPGDGRGVRRPRRVGAGGARRRRARRADHHHDQHGVGGRWGRGASGDARPGGARACRRRPGRTCAAATRRATPAVFRALVAGERGPVRDAVLLNAAGALVAFDGAPAELADGLPRRAGSGRRPRSTPERRPRCWTGGPRFSPRCAADHQRSHGPVRPSSAQLSPGRPRRWPRCPRGCRSGTRCGCRCAARPSTLLSRPAITSASCSCSLHLDHRDQVHVAGAGVHLGHPVQVGDGLRRLRDAVGGGVHQDDRGDHIGLLGVGAARRAGRLVHLQRHRPGPLRPRPPGAPRPGPARSTADRRAPAGCRRWSASGAPARPPRPAPRAAARRRE